MRFRAAALRPAPHAPIQSGMSTDPSPATDEDAAPRGSRELWLNAAYEALISGGAPAVKVLPLADKLGLSRTSFYWFFSNRAALLDALLERWEGATTAPLIAAAGDYAATGTEAMLHVIGLFLSDSSFDSSMERAVRAWAQQDAGVQARLAAADAARIAALAAMLERWGHAPADADVRARAIYLVQIGYISMKVEESREERLSRFPAYVEIYTGRRPNDEEMARCRARVARAAS